jgi:translation initiation factor IF-2
MPSCNLFVQVGEIMAGAAPRVEQERVVGEAQVLQVFKLNDKRGGGPATVAGCRISEGSIRADGRYRVLRQGQPVRPFMCFFTKITLHFQELHCPTHET